MFAIFDSDNSVNADYQVTVTGDGSTNDFDIFPVRFTDETVNRPELEYDPSTGIINDPTNGSNSSESGALIGTSTTLISSITLTGNNITASDAIAFYVGAFKLCDTDGDGIIDSCDLDSDGDGCPDAIEAGIVGVDINTQSTAIDAESMLVGGVNDFGIPLVATDSQTSTTTNYSNPGIWQNASINFCDDKDMDGVPDFTDLDDDNDGILDSIEIVSCIDTSFYADLTAATVTNPRGPTAIGSGASVDGVPFTVYMTERSGGSLGTSGDNSSQGLMINTLGVWDNSIYTPSNSAASRFSVRSDLNNSDNDFIDVVIPFDQPVYNLRLHIAGLDYSRIQFTGNHSESILSGGTELTLNALRILRDSSPSSIGDPTRDGFGTISIMSIDGQPIDTIKWTYLDTGSTSQQTDTHQITLFGSSGACDVDGDGIPAACDLDSDGDGCPDALEGASTTITIGDLVDSAISGGNSGPDYIGSSTDLIILNIGNDVDINGVPNSANGGQGIGASQDPDDATSCSQSDFGDYTPFGIAEHMVIEIATDGTPDNTDAVWLGATVDYETSQQNSGDAMGDDDNGDDEDAISNFPTDLENGTGTSFDLTLNSNTSDEVFYGVWIDYDCDGTYDEFVAGSGMTAGPLTVMVNILPNVAVDDSVKLRVRVDTVALVAADIIGLKMNGEVEDWIIPQTTCPSVSMNTITADQDICLNAAAMILDGEAVVLTPIGTSTYQWISSPSGANTYTDIATAATAEDYDPGSPIIDTDYRRMVLIDGCPTDTSNTVTITINALPMCNAGNNGPICAGADVTLMESGGNATSWSWTSDGSATFDDATAQSPVASDAVDGEVFTVVVTDGNMCTSTCTTTVTVNALPMCNAINNGPICAGADVTLMESGGNATSWSWTSDGSATFDDATAQSPVASDAVDGEVFTVVVTDGNMCTSTCTTTVTVNALPMCNASNNGPICAGADVTLMETGDDATSWSWTSDGSATFDDATAQSPVASDAVDGEVFTVVITDVNMCTSTCMSPVTVIALPTVTLGSAGPLCTNDDPADITYTPTGGVFTAQSGLVDDGSGTATFDPELSGAGTFTIEYTYIDPATSCQTTESTMVTVNQAPTVDAGTNEMKCPADDLALDATITDAGANNTILWTTTGGSFDDATIEDPVYTMMTPGTQTLTLTVTNDDNGCSEMSTVDITVVASPTLTLTSAECTADLAGYVVEVVTDAGAVITTTAGNVSGTTIFDIPAGTDITVTSTLMGCTTELAVTAPVCACPTVNPPVSGGDQEICVGDTNPFVQATAGGSGEVTDWYDAATDGNQLIAGSIAYMTTQTAIGTYSYFAEARSTSTGCVSATRTEVIFTVNALPVIDAGTMETICDDETLTLNPTTSGAATLIFDWSADGGSFVDNTIEDAMYNNAIPGDYVLTLLVTDGNGCTAMDDVMVTVNPNPVLTIGSVSCVPEGMGSFTYSVMYTGDGIVTTDIMGVTNTGTEIQDIPNGMDIVLTATLDGCTTSITVAAPDCNCPVLTPPTSGGDEEICFGGINPTLSASIVSGMDLGVVWFDAASGGLALDTALTYTATQTAPGTYSYFVETRDTVTGCFSTPRVEVIYTVNDLPSVDAGPATDDKCPEETLQLDGTVSGVSAFTYAWTATGGSFVDATVLDAEYNMMMPGVYTLTLTVTDGNGCMSTDAIDVTVFTSPDPTLSVDNAGPLCETDAAVTITADIIGGTYSQPTGVTDNGDGTATLDLSMTGLGDIKVFYDYADINGCLSKDSITINVIDSPELVDVTPTNTTFCGVNDGTITITATTGIAPLQYSIDGGITFFGNNVFDMLGAGSYDVVIQNTDGSCPVSGGTVMIEDVDNIVITSTTASNPTSCGGDNGSIAINATGDAMKTLEYSIDGGPYSISNTFSMLSAGMYDISIRYTDNSCLLEVFDVTLADPAVPVVQASGATDASGCDIDDGSFTITALGGVLALTYSIDNGMTFQNSNMFTGLMAGTYQIVVAGSNETCLSIPFEATIGAPAQPIINDVVTTDPSDCLSSTGSLTVLVEGGTGTRMYSINGGTTQTSPTFSMLTAGLYQVIVTNADGSCPVMQTVELFDPEAPMIVNVIIEDEGICATDNGTITIIASGGIAPYEYSFNGGGSWETESTMFDLAPGTYELSVRNGNNTCPSALQDAVVGEGSCDCNDVVNTGTDICEFILNNPGADLEALDCDMDGVTNLLECNPPIGTPPTDPIDPCDNPYTTGAEVCAAIDAGATGFADVDCDGGGINDAIECDGGTDPTDPCDDILPAGTTLCEVVTAAGEMSELGMADCDMDGVSNWLECNPPTGTPPTDPTDPCDNPYTSGAEVCAAIDAGATGFADVDCDGGGINDAIECDGGTDPIDPCDDILPAGTTLCDVVNAAGEMSEVGMADCDMDGVSNWLECNPPGGTPPTDPIDPCDNPYTTGAEVCAAIDAGATGFADVDCDGGGINDAIECDGGTNPIDPCDDILPAGTTLCDVVTAAGEMSEVGMADCDMDGVSNWLECNPPGGTPPTDPIDPCDNPYTTGAEVCAAIDAGATGFADVDCDGGGINDAIECDGGTDPTDPCDDILPAGTTLCDVVNAAGEMSEVGMADCDMDGVSNWLECNPPGGTPPTDPTDPCDNPYTSGAEVCAAIDAGATGFADVDCDMGGINDEQECTDMTDPTDPCDDILPAGTTLCDVVTAAGEMSEVGMADCDMDGVSNWLECNPPGGTPPTDPTDPCDNPYTSGDEVCAAIDAGATGFADVDCDGGGINDAIECDGGTDPTDPCDDILPAGTTLCDVVTAAGEMSEVGMADCDMDGVSNWLECNPPGGTPPTDPIDPCDNPYTSGAEVCAAIDAGATGFADVDCDGGGINDAIECDGGTDPTDPCDDILPAGTTLCEVVTAAGEMSELGMADCDMDGVSNWLECNPPTGTPPTDPTDPCDNPYTSGTEVCAAIDAGATGFADVDCDMGGINDEQECTDMTDPTDPCDDILPAGTTLCDVVTAAGEMSIVGMADCDMDGVSNWLECNPPTGTPPTDPTDPCDNPYTSGDEVCAAIDAGATGFADVDCDMGGINDEQECTDMTDPTDPCDDILPAGTTLCDVVTAAGEMSEVGMADCDMDGTNNWDECNPPIGVPPTDPTDPCDNPYVSGDQICVVIATGMAPGLAASDCDSGGISDGQECTDMTDPTDPCDDILPAGTTLCEVVTAAGEMSEVGMADCDMDGVSNWLECNPPGGTPPTDPTDPCDNPYTSGAEVCAAIDAGATGFADVDCDGGGINDAIECDGGTDPTDPCDDILPAGTTLCEVVTAAGEMSELGMADCDMDGVSNWLECNPPTGTPPTDPTDPCDNPYTSGAEVCAAIDAGATGFADVDCDMGGINDEQECTDMTDPTDPCDDILPAGTTLCDVVTAAGEMSIVGMADCDMDGVSNWLECNPPTGTPPTDPTDPCDNPYTSGDEVCAAIDAGATGFADVDCDMGGVNDAEECNPPIGVDPTDPMDPCDDPGLTGDDICASIDALGMASSFWGSDCDNGGVPNEIECANGGDPLLAEDDCDSADDPDYDLCTYVLDNPASVLALADCDNGGISNITECLSGGDPLDPIDDSNPNPDENVTYVDVEVTGDVSTNDQNFPDGSTYNNPMPNTANPDDSLPMINPDGTYTFTSPVPGVFTFEVPVTLPDGEVIIEELVITVLDSDIDNNVPVANVDIATTPYETPVTLATLANDYPGNPGTPLDPGTVNVTEAPTNGTTMVDPITGDIIYTPNDGFIGTDTLTYEVYDVDGNVSTAQQIITVLGPDAQNTTTAADDNTTTPFETPVSGSVSTNDTDAEGDNQMVTPQITTIPNVGTLVLMSDGSYEFTPADGFSGPVDFPYTVTDDNGDPATTMATLHILVQPEVFTTTPDENVTYVDTPVNGDVSTNDGNVPDGSTYGNPTAVPGNPDGSLPVIAEDGTYVFESPVPGVFTFEVPVTLPDGEVIIEELVITVLDSDIDNNVPVANVDIATTPYETPVTLATLANDYPGNPGTPLDPGTVNVTEAPTNGTTMVDPITGDIIYTPNDGFIGTDTLTYEVYDVDGNVSTAQQIITVLGPDAQNTTTAADDNTTTPFETPVSGSVSTNDTDAEGDNQMVTPQITTIPNVGTLVLMSDGSYEFTPADGFSGPVDFPYTVMDDNDEPATTMATLHILVQPEVIVPTPDENVTFVDVPVTGDVSTNDGGIPEGSTYGDPVPDPNNPDGSLPVINEDGTYTFESPVPGVFTFQVPLMTPDGDIILVDLVITVLDPDSNDNVPVANIDIGSTPPNTPITLVTLANDYAGVPGVFLIPSTVTVVMDPPNGMTSVNPATGDITYTPNDGFIGMDTLTYQITDSNGNVSTAQQIITVLGENAPNSTVAADDNAVTPVNTPVTGNVLINDNDPENDEQTVIPQVTTIPGVGTLTLNGDGSYEFVPEDGFVGPIDFPYEVTDENGASAMATLHILVRPPVAMVTGFMWEDLDGDGIQDSGEPGIPGLSVTLLNLQGDIAGIAITDANGMYTFMNVEPEMYYSVQVDIESTDFTLTTQGTGNDDTIDSDLENLLGTITSGLFFVEDGEEEVIDGGFYVCVNIGDLVWLDLNENDIADPNENGINGLDVNLYVFIDGGFQLVQTTETGHKPGTPSDDGWFNFCAPAGMTYYIEVIMPPLGLVQTLPNVGNNEDIDSDLTNAFGVGTSNSFFLSAGQDKYDLGAGFYKMATIGNRVWSDINENGIQDSGELSVSGVLVEAFELETGEKIAESTTNFSGIYSIEYLQKKDYYLKFTPPNGYGFTIPNEGGESVDSDVDHSYGYKTTAAYSMEPGKNYINVDAGLKFGVLPVEWLDVVAKNKGDINLISWRTATEINSDYFTIERKLENGDFVSIGEMKAAGESFATLSYEFEDQKIATGFHYYRIKQIDLDGKFDYSDIVKVDVRLGEDKISLSPNPARDKSILSLSLLSGSDVSIKVIGNDGRLVRSYNVPTTGTNEINTTIEITDLPTGVYMIHVNQDTFTDVKRLIVVR